MIPKEEHHRIPEGVYCYGAEGNCPFWFRNEYGFGDCKALIRFENKPFNGDRGEFDGALDDQCKACGVNYNLV